MRKNSQDNSGTATYPRKHTKTMSSHCQTLPTDNRKAMQLLNHDKTSISQTSEEMPLPQLRATASETMRDVSTWDIPVIMRGGVTLVKMCGDISQTSVRNCGSGVEVVVVIIIIIMMLRCCHQE